MNRRLLKLEIAGFIFVSITGTIMHFVYDWTNQNIIAGLISPVNESPWEHLKLIFFPCLIYTIFTSIKLKNNKSNVYFSNFIGVMLGMWATLSYFYTLNGIIGGNNEWVNLSSFFVGVAVVFIVSYFLINNSVGKSNNDKISFFLMIVIVIIFTVFTFMPPLIPLFQDPISLTYGV